MTDPTQISINHLPQSPLGVVWVALSAKGLWALDFNISKDEFIRNTQDRGSVQIIKNDFNFKPAINQTDQYLTGKRKDFSLTIDWSGMTEFQILVRNAVMEIPGGETASYGEIATKIGRPRAARAVGFANATNPIPLVIPCHRVVGTDGALRGYGGAGGLKTKQWLLDLEKGE